MIKQNITKTRTKMILITKTLVIFLLGGQVSEWRSVLSRVHQGSVLGPLLFVLYINDADDSASSKILKFADDIRFLIQFARKRL